MTRRGGSLPDARGDKLGRLHWKGFGLVAPAKTPTYMVLGGLALGFEATMADKRSLSSASNSIELFIVKIKKFSDPLLPLKTILAWSQIKAVI